VSVLTNDESDLGWGRKGGGMAAMEIEKNVVTEPGSAHSGMRWWGAVVMSGGRLVPTVAAMPMNRGDRWGRQGRVAVVLPRP
jgi:hypothetical protein